MRKSMVEEYPHSLPREEAVARVKALTDFWARRFGIHTEWRGTSGQISGQVLGIRFRAVFSVLEDRLWGELQSGFVGTRLGGRSYLLRKLALYLDPRRSLTELQATG
jgi:hypothetical protein